MGISFSTTTTTRRRNSHQLYPPPPPLHPHPLDYFSTSYPAPLPPYPTYSPPSPHVYHPFYDSNAYSVCNHGNPFVGQPYFGPLEWQSPPLSRVMTPPSGDPKTSKVVNSELNVHKDSLRLEADELTPDRYLVSFVFDALLDGSITVCYFAKEHINRGVVPLFPETYVPIKVPFRKGLHQEFRQPPGTGIDFRLFPLDDLASPSSRDDVFPIVISAETYPSDYVVADRNYLLAHELPQMQISQVVVAKNHEGQFTAKVIRQLLWTDDICYELREIYGLGKSSPGISENGSGKECVICMTEPKDIAVLPCRHLCMCSDCAKTLSLQSNKCPICREIIEGLLEIKIDTMEITDTSSFVMAFAGIKPTGDNIDIAWKWNSLKDISNKKKVVCDYCGKVSSGGISRAKQHQLGIKGQVTPCATFPDEYKQELREAEAKKKGEINSYTNQSYRDEEEEEELQEIANIRSGKRLASMESSQNSKKGKIIKGPMDLLLYKAPESTINKGNDKRQQNIKEACEKEARARTIQYISRFFCTNGIAFNVVRSKSFKLMVEAIGNYGPHLKAPSYHEMRVPLLKKELDYTKELMKNHEDERVKHGCSIMSDGWTDRKRRTLINFLVNSPAGSMFVRSVDASDIIKTGAAIFELLDNFVEEIGEKNVVQVITDNGSNFRLAGELLEARRKHLFWTPCAAHCIDLMLEDIGKISKVKKAIQNGISLVSFVYNHSFALSLMRKFTNKTELVKHGVTRFATSFLTLTRLNDLKRNLRKMFTSEEWSKSKLAKDRKGKNATSIVISPTFWNGVGYTLKVMKPLVDVLRLVDNEKKPAMGYIYEAMDRAKVTIQNKFKGDEEKYKDIFAIIDTRWECQLHHPLHAAGLYLNPNFYFNKQSIEYDSKVTEGLYKCIERLGENIEVVDKIMEELLRYKAASGMFGIPAAIRQRTKISPAAWWGLYGSQTPNLQKLAIKVLSLTCSSSGCERNWSIFEHIHSKKRSKLEHQKLQDLVYIKYNQALKDRFDCSDLIDPIVLNDIDDSNEWLVGRQRGGEDVGDEGNEDEDAGDDLVFEDDNLTWRDVDKASGASEPLVYTRQNTRSSGTSTSIPSSSSGKGKGKQVMIVEEDFDDDTSEEDDEEYVYKDSSDENDDEDDLVVGDD